MNFDSSNRIFVYGGIVSEWVRQPNDNKSSLLQNCQFKKSVLNYHLYPSDNTFLKQLPTQCFRHFPSLIIENIHLLINKTSTANYWKFGINPLNLHNKLMR